jgi:hypothetical protein
VDRIEAAYDLVLNGQVDAVISLMPCPTLLCVSNGGKGKVQTVGSILK